MKFRVISTGSKGNAVLYDDSFLVDCGVSYTKIKNFNIKIVFLTHIHSDHLNLNALKSLQNNNPKVRIVCGSWMIPSLEALKKANIDVLDFGVWYEFGIVKACMVKLYHDVENCGYRFILNNEKIFHATDTYTLQGIQAKGYDLYAIEHNYDEDLISDIIDKKISSGQYAYERKAMKNHLSIQDAEAFIIENRKKTSKVIKLHMSGKFDE